MIALSTILLPLMAAAPSKTTSLVGHSRLLETRTVSPSGHEEISWSRSETRIHLLVDHQRYGTNRYYYVLREESLQDWNDESDGATTKLTFTRLDRTTTGYDSIAWTLSVPGNNSSFYDGMIQTLWYGCCDQEDEYRFIAPATGKLIAVTSERPLSLQGSHQRLYIGFHPPPRPRPAQPKSAASPGTLVLFSSDSLLDELPIKLATPQRWSPVIQVMQNTIHLEFEEGDSATVEVTKARQLRRTDSPATKDRVQEVPKR
jgi:hypothetical protein